MSRRRTAWAWAAATVFGTGYLRPGPGTWGSAASLACWLAAAAWLHPTRVHLVEGTLLASLIVLLAGIPAASIVARESGTNDPGFVVLDEVVGQWIALAAAVPARWQEWLLAFLLFRLFDITKPPPARQFDRMHGGFGIMMDDVAAGLYALIFVFLAHRFI
jgi:phosphatidylglycerophosphatase A